MKKSRRPAPFFGLNDRMPVFLAILLGFQHSLAMLAGVLVTQRLLQIYLLIHEQYHTASDHCISCWI